MVGNPGLTKAKSNMEKLHPSYRAPICKGLICLENGMLILKEPITGEQIYRHLRIVPKDLYNIVFVAFHANPIGGHFGLNETII